MANIKSARKRVLIEEVRRLRNRGIRSTVHTAVRRFEGTLGASASATDREQAFRAACSELDRAVTRGVLHRNAAARKKSRLSKKFGA
ncbi:Ribosomal protein S20 [mine drainage metagenome]|uniref:Ribosomal protein S20 n=1 Tax=mine drainage metagenome TaxID=410659 RepID=T0Z7B8_9ZZZZ